MTVLQEAYESAMSRLFAAAQARDGDREMIGDRQHAVATFAGTDLIADEALRVFERLGEGCRGPQEVRGTLLLVFFMGWEAARRTAVAS